MTVSRNVRTVELKTLAFSNMKPWAPPRTTASRAPGIASATSSASAIGVSTSWLPTMTRVGAVTPERA